jgi:ketosteroid isomerase-like protein
MAVLDAAGALDRSSPPGSEHGWKGAYSRSVHANERFVRSLYEAMARGDGRHRASALTPSTQWIMPGRGVLSGTYTGPDEIFGLWRRIAEQGGGGLRLELRDVVANDEIAVALVTVRGSRSDRQLEERQVAVLELEDDHVKSAAFIYEDPQAYDEFWR